MERKGSPDDFYENDFDEPVPVTIEDRSTPEPAVETKEPDQPVVVKEVRKPAAAVTSSDEEQASKVDTSPKPQKTLRYENVFNSVSESNAPIEPSQSSDGKKKKG